MGDNHNRMIRFGLMLTALMAVIELAGCTPKVQQPKDIQNFDHYTFAVMWQPGVCATWDYAKDACTDRSPTARINRQWTMHGLWASIPTELTQKGMQPPTWWKYGCYYFNPSHKMPENSCGNRALNLPAEVRERLNAQMPMTAICLDQHEFYKHAVCYGHSPAEFFTHELDLLDKLNATPFTAWVREHRGQWVTNAEFHAAFAQNFGAQNAHALELRCKSKWDERKKKGDIFTQAWITIQKDKLDQFPSPGSLKAGRTGNCAARIHILQ